METEERSLVVIPQTTMETVHVIQALAPIMQASRMFKVTPEQAAVIMLTGHELGVGLAASFQFIHVVEDKPSISPKCMMALIHGSNMVDVKITRLPEDKAQPLIGYECWMKRKSSGFEHTARFTLDDAKRAGLVKPRSAWESYPENLCMWRAVGFCADVVCPDLGGGMYRPEELGAVVNQDGEPVTIEGTATPCPETQTVTATIPTANISYTLQSLVSQFGAEAVMAANDGRIPANDAELATIATKLEATNAA